MPGDNPRLFLFATIRPRPEHFGAAKAALDGIIVPTLEEAGCHIFAAFESGTEPHTLHLFECFDDEAALNLHYEQGYTKNVFRRYADWLRAPVEITRMSALSPSSLAQFAA